MVPRVDRNQQSSGLRNNEQGGLPNTIIPFEFTAKHDEYFRIWIVNVALTICTLGIYSAWAKVRKKRYLYGNTLLEGTPFEYNGDPVKILKGRLIVGGGLLAYFAMTFILPVVDAYGWLLFLLILPWIVVRSRTFNARNSSYRNIRFDFRTTWGEAFKVFFGIGLIGATGVGYPYFVYRRTRFVMDHSRYGLTPFALDWEDMIWTIYGAYLAAGFLFLVLFFGFGIVLLPFSSLIDWRLVQFLLILGLPLFVFLPTWALLRTTLLNLLWSCCTIGRHRFKSTLKVWWMIWLYVSNAIAILLSLGLLIPWATLRMLRYRLENFSLEANGDLNDFVSSQQQEVNAAGEEAVEFLDVDLGL